MANSNLTTKTLSFSQEFIESGHLAILYDSGNQLIGTGIILEVNPLTIRIALYLADRSYRSSYESDGLSDLEQVFLEQVSPYLLQIKHVESGETQLFIINPYLYSRGDDDAPVHC